MRFESWQESAFGMAAVAAVLVGISFLSPAVACADEAIEATAETRPTDRPHLVVSLQYGVVTAAVDAGIRFDHFEVGAGMRGYLDSSAKYVSGKLILLPEEVATVYAYGRVGMWHDDGGAFFSKGDEPSGGLLTAGGLGLELHLGDVAFLQLEVGGAHQNGTSVGANKLDVGLGFGLRL